MSGTFPVFVSEMFCELLVVPITWSANTKAWVLSSAVLDGAAPKPARLRV